MPYVEINGDGTLTHAQLVYGDGRIVCEFYPADNAACRALKPPDSRTRCAHLAEIQSHTAAEFRYLSEIAYRAVNAFKRIGDDVYKTGRKLVVGLARVGQGRRCNGYLQLAQHAVKTQYPAGSVGFFVHRQMHGDSHKHFLRRFKRHVCRRADKITAYE